MLYLNYAFIESLVLMSKDKNEEALNKLIEEFTPLINGLCRKTFITGYTFDDLKQECMISLLNCVQKYKSEDHRFVAYATNGIKNNLNYLIKKNLTHKEVSSQESLTYTGILEDLNLRVEDEADLNLIDKHNKKIIMEAVSNILTDEEVELFIYVQLKGHTLNEYAALKGIAYSTASKKRKIVVKKVRNYMQEENSL